MRKAPIKKVKFHIPVSKSLALPLLALGGGIWIGYGVHFIMQDEKPQNPIPIENTISVCFTPEIRCKAQIIREIDGAQKSIHVQAYSFTDRDISTSLIQAQKRGISVRVLLDKSNIQDNRSTKNMLRQSGVPLRFDSPNGIAHNKIIIIDQEEVLTGSYNFSVAAYKRNTENLLIIRNKELSDQYMKNWEKRWNVSNEQ